MLPRKRCEFEAFFEVFLKQKNLPEGRLGINLFSDSGKHFS